MSRKRKVRELAMQVLFLWDAHAQPDPALAQEVLNERIDDAAIRRRALELATAAWEKREIADQWVERVAPHWPPRRQPGVDRNILRLAVWELTNSSTPSRVVIDEAIEIAKEFSTEQSAAFVNAVLDAVLREHNALLAGIDTLKSAPEVEIPPPTEPSGGSSKVEE
jgi:N utilization substance protein B